MNHRVVVSIVTVLLTTALGLLVCSEDRHSGKLVLPCVVTEVYDGDTVTVEVTIKARVRLLDCWAPEIRTKDKAEKRAGYRSRDYLMSIAQGREGVITVPLGSRLGESFTFGRVLGRIIVDGVDLSAAMVEGGYATRTKE